MQSMEAQQQYIEVWFDSSLEELTEIQKRVKEYFLKYANPVDFQLEVEIRNGDYAGHTTYYGTSWLTKNYGTKFCADTEAFTESNKSFATFGDMKKLDKLLERMDLAVRDKELIQHLTGLISINALFMGCGYNLLYAKEYRPFITIACDWDLY